MICEQCQWSVIEILIELFNSKDNLYFCLTEYFQSEQGCEMQNKSILLNRHNKDEREQPLDHWKKHHMREQLFLASISAIEASNSLVL